MKVLFINDYSTPTGGAEFLTLALRDGLKQRGHDARLFSSSAYPLDAPSFADYECLGSLSSFRLPLQTFNPWAWLKLRQILLEFQPDLVHVTIALTQLSPSIFSLLKNVPTVYNAQWYRMICPVGTKILPTGESCQFTMGKACYKQRCLPLQDWLFLMAQMHMVRQSLDVFDKIVAASLAVKEHLLAEDIKVTDVVLNGIPVSPPRPLLNSPPTVVFAGRLVWEKGVDVLLQAFAIVQQKLPEAKLIIAGEGKERVNLERLAAKLNLGAYVTFLGHLSRVDLENYFAQAWVQVVPSRWAEPFGLVAAEAHMRGSAVIASASGGLVEIVEDRKTGFLVTPNDVNSLADALTQLLSNKNLAEEMGAKGRERALKYFSEDIYVDQFVDLYRSLLKKK